MNSYWDQATPAGESVTALAVGLANADLEALRAVFRCCGWTLVEAGGSGEAKDLLSSKCVPVVFCARELPDGEWHAFLDWLHTISSPPNLILTSHLVDDRLWVEVLKRGGYDVLPCPFEAHELIRVVKVAWLSWRYEWEWGYAPPARVSAGARAAGSAAANAVSSPELSVSSPEL